MRRTLLAIVIYVCCLTGCAVAPRTSALSENDVERIIGAEVERLLSPDRVEATVAAVVKRTDQSAGRDVNSFDRVTLWIMAGGYALAGLFYPMIWRPLAKRRRRIALRQDIAMLVSEAVEHKAARHKGGCILCGDE